MTASERRTSSLLASTPTLARLTLEQQGVADQRR
jgi:hypothetical protein